MAGSRKNLTKENIAAGKRGVTGYTKGQEKAQEDAKNVKAVGAVKARNEALKSIMGGE